MCAAGAPGGGGAIPGAPARIFGCARPPPLQTARHVTESRRGAPPAGPGPRARGSLAAHPVPHGVLSGRRFRTVADRHLARGAGAPDGRDALPRLRLQAAVGRGGGRRNHHVFRPDAARYFQGATTSYRVGHSAHGRSRCVPAPLLTTTAIERRAMVLYPLCCGLAHTSVRARLGRGRPRSRTPPPTDRRRVALSAGGPARRRAGARGAGLFGAFISELGARGERGAGRRGLAAATK